MSAEIGKLLIVLGLLLVVSGVLLTWIPGLRLGRLPGDIVIRRGNWSFYLPISTSLSISIVLSLLLWILASLRR